MKKSRYSWSLHVERTVATVVVATVLDSWAFQRMEVSTGIFGAEHKAGGHKRKD